MTSRTVSFSPQAVNVFFHILTNCNLNCRHCYINPDQHGRGKLSLETMESWLAACAQNKAEANVIFLGGEPTLHPALPGAIASAKQMGYQSVTIDTNGYLFGDILSRTSPELVDYISFSLDGATARTNDALRGQGAYQQCLKGLTEAAKRGYRTSLIYTVSSANIHELPAMNDLLKTIPVHRFFIQVLGIRGNTARETASEKRLQQVTRRQWLAEIPPTAEKIAATHRIPVIYPPVFLDPEETFACAGRVADNCFIFPNGRVYRCPLCEDFPWHSRIFQNGRLEKTSRINEEDLFQLDIREGCVLNKLIQPDNLRYGPDGQPEYQIACCLLKTEVPPGGSLG